MRFGQAGTTRVSGVASEGARRGFDVDPRARQMVAMREVPAILLEAIGLDAAHELIGEGQAQDNEVTTGPDSSDEPAYYFSFLIEQDHDPRRAAQLHTRLAELVALGKAGTC